MKWGEGWKKIEDGENCEGIISTIFIRETDIPMQKICEQRLRALEKGRYDNVFNSAWLSLPTFIFDIFESLGEEVMVVSSDSYCVGLTIRNFC